jgi:hypothetical protein
VKGPTNSIPILWATNAKPQMMAASRRIRSDRSFGFISWMLDAILKFKSAKVERFYYFYRN